MAPDIKNLTRIIPRKDWKADPPAYQLPLKLPVPYVLFTITETDACHNTDECIKAVKKLQRQHMAEGMPDIRFNFLIGDDLCIYEGRGWDVQPSITETHYTPKAGQILEIAYMGEYEQNFPTQPVLDVRDALVMFGFLHNYIDKSKFLQPS